MVSGAIAGVFDRYQGRVAWLASLGVATFVASTLGGVLWSTVGPWATFAYGAACAAAAAAVMLAARGVVARAGALLREGDAVRPVTADVK